METQVEMNPVYVLRLTRLEAAKLLVDPKEAQVAVRAMLSPDGGPEKIVQAITAVANGDNVPRVKALPAGPVKRPAPRVVPRNKHTGPKPGVKAQCKYCARQIAPWRMSTHVAGAHPQAPESEKPASLRRRARAHHRPKSPPSAGDAARVAPAPENYDAWKESHDIPAS